MSGIWESNEKIAECVIVVKKSRNVASGPPFPDPFSCENLYGILISNYYCSHWQAAIFLCVFVCVAVIQKIMIMFRCKKK